MLAKIRGETDPLQRAEGLLRFHQHERSPGPQPLEDLRFARAVFAANKRPHDEIRVVFVLLNSLRILGAAQCAHAVARRALEQMALSVEERAGLAYQGLHALTQLQRYEEAEALAERYLVPALDGSQGARPRFIWWMSLGWLRTQQMSRAACWPNITSLDLPPDREPDRQATQLRLVQAQQCLDAARDIAGSPLDRQILQLFEMLVLGCRGEVEAASALFDTIDAQCVTGNAAVQLGLLVNHGLLLQGNGHHPQAYAVLMRAEALARESDAHGPWHMASYSLARLAQDMGDTRTAVTHYETFVRLHAETRRQSESWFTDREELGVYGPRPAAVPVHPEQLRAVKPPFLRRALTQLDQRLCDPPSVHTLAQELGVSVRSLEAAMKRYEGLSPVAYVRERRMRRALEQLQHTGLRVGDIAAGLGYSQVGSFTRDFRKVFGLSPTEVRTGSGA